MSSAVNGDPVAVVTNYLPARIFFEELIGAVIAAEEEASVLETSVGSALLIIKETTYDTQNVAIEFSLSLLRGDRYTASVISVRKN